MTPVQIGALIVLVTDMLIEEQRKQAQQQEDQDRARQISEEEHSYMKGNHERD